MGVVIGTAGHIDHGKTALVKALTGTDADRLPEEKKRGITIDIGFADLDLGDVQAAFVDVPGHERFVKNMLAGASGIDIVMLVVAADDGVRPQTREHFNICRLLGLRSGLVVITKADLADADMVELVRLDVAELVEGSFLENAEIAAVSARTGEGVEQLKETLNRVAHAVPARRNDKVMMMPVDRSFTIKGHGAVATGTLRSGEITLTSELELLPAGQPVRVRGIQSHGRASDAAATGRRVAVNLGGVDHGEIRRGMVLAERGVLRPSPVVDTLVEVLGDAVRPLRSRQRVRLHIGTAEVLARVSVLDDGGEIDPGRTGLVQLRLESPVVAVHGERFIIRSYSPPHTIAGGTLLDPFAARHRKREFGAIRERLMKLAEEPIENEVLASHFVSAAGEAGLTPRDLAARTGWRSAIVTGAIDTATLSGRIVDAGGILLDSNLFGSLQRRTLEAVERHHKKEPLSKGLTREAAKDQVSRKVPGPAFEAVLASLAERGSIRISGDTVSVAQRKAEFSPQEAAAREKISSILVASRLEVPKLNDLLEDAARASTLSAVHVRKVLQTLLDGGEILKVSDDFYFAREVIDTLAGELRTYAEKGDRVIDVPKFKQIAGVSRKYAIPLLEYFDREKVTLRTGDKRVIR